jgi:hypothetical protein
MTNVPKLIKMLSDRLIDLSVIANPPGLTVMSFQILDS